MDDQTLARLIAVTGRRAAAMPRWPRPCRACGTRPRARPRSSWWRGSATRPRWSRWPRAGAGTCAAKASSSVPMGGATNIGSFLDLFGPQRPGRPAGRPVRRGGRAAFPPRPGAGGPGPGPARADLERLGFYVCVADLEDEMIRSLGAAAVERLIAAQGELAGFRTLLPAARAAHRAPSCSSLGPFGAVVARAGAGLGAGLTGSRARSAGSSGASRAGRTGFAHWLAAAPRPCDDRDMSI